MKTNKIAAGLKVTAEQALKLLEEKIDQLNDPADPRGKKYSLPQVIKSVLLGLLQGANDLQNIERELKQNLDTVCLALESESIASHDTMGRRLDALDPEKLETLLMEWALEITDLEGETVSFDGKALRAGADSVHGETVPYVVDLFASKSSMCIGCLHTPTKKNEVSAARTAIDKLGQINKGCPCLFRADALMTRNRTMGTIENNSGRFCLPVKGNNRKLMREMEKIFREIDQTEQARKEILETCSPGITIVSFYEQDDLEFRVQTEKGHGREETRKCTLLKNVEQAGIEFEGRPVKSIARLEHKTRRTNKTKKTGKPKKETSTVIHYFIMDYVPENVDILTEEIRDEWDSENKLHWVEDTAFNEDRSTIRKVNLRSNMAVLRRIVLNLIRIFELPEADMQTVGAKRLYLSHHILEALMFLLCIDNEESLEKLLFVYTRSEVKNNIKKMGLSDKSIKKFTNEFAQFLTGPLLNTG